MSATTVSTPGRRVSVRARMQGKSALRRAVDLGLIGGLAALLLALVGMIESFSDRYLLREAISSGQALVAAVMLGVGYVATKRADTPGRSWLEKSAFGAIAGLIIGLVLAALVLVGSVINLRAVLVNASPALYEILTFGQGVGVGIGLLALAGAVMGWVGGLLFVLPARYSDALIVGLLSLMLIGLLRDIVRLVLNQYEPTKSIFRFLFTPSKGMTVAGALTVFLVPALLRLAWASNQEMVRTRYEALPAASKQTTRWAGIAFFIVFLLLFPFIFGKFPTEAMNNVILLGVLMGLGLNIVVGFAGMLDLGYVGFFAIGAYTMALLTSPEIGWTIGFWQALPFSVLVSIIAGVILGIPVLKMRGDYLAIVTLGFGEIIRILVLSDWLRPWFNGAPGITRIPPPPVLGNALNEPPELYYLLLVAVALTMFLSTRLRDSRLGRAWMAVREDEDVAEAMGIDLVATKLKAFATGAAMAGLGGAIFAAKLQSIVPQTFDLLISVNALSIIIVGGLASVPGVVVGALLLIGLPEILREFAEYRLWVYGALLVVMMLYKPEGFWPEETRQRELHSFDNPDLSPDHTLDSDLVTTAEPGINDPVVSGAGHTQDTMKE